MSEAALQEDIPTSEYLAEIAQLHERVARQDEEIKLLHEKIHYLLHQKFGRKSERFNPDQLSLFEEGSLDPEAIQEPEPIEVPGHQRTRKGRGKPPAHLPRVRVEHDLPDEEKRCDCGACLERFDEITSEQYDVIPPKFQVLEHVRFKYACPACRETIRTSDLPPQPLPRTQASAGMLAWLGSGKFADGLPVHRQTKILERRFEIPFTSTTLNQWLIQSAETLLKPLTEAMARALRTSDYWCMDETRLQVLEEEGRKASQLSWLWIRINGHGTPIILFDYRTGRSGAVAKELTEGFQGWLQSDGLGSYDAAAGEKIEQLGCWAHVRRKFDAAIKAAGKHNKPPALAAEALQRIRRLYQLDREIRNKPPDERLAHRQQHSKPLLTDFRRWIDARLGKALAHDDQLAKAFIYLHNQWPKLVRFVEDGRLALDNNTAERHIRPIAVGRNNWLFSRSTEGAHATALWYSVVETAKANGWDPYHYLRLFFEKAPAYLQQNRPLDDLLPWVVRPKQD